MSAFGGKAENWAFPLSTPKPDDRNQHAALLERQDCTLVGGNCWPHSAARQSLGPSRQARSSWPGASVCWRQYPRKPTPPISMPCAKVSGNSDMTRVEASSLSIDLPMAAPNASRPWRQSWCVSMSINATRTIPIVMASVGDVIGTGLAVSLARPGGNVTGLTAINTDTEGKRLELLKEMVPGLVRIAALYNMGNPTFALRWKEVELAARALGVESQLLDVRKPEDIAPAFAAATAQRAGALLTSVDA